MTTPTRVGELRPSQLLYTFGVGSVVDLPNLSGLILGLDEWDTADATQVNEKRLLSVIRSQLGNQVSALLLPPYVEESPNPLDESWVRVGVPVATFPQWMRCPFCNYLGPLSSKLFELKRDPYRPDRVRYEHTNCRKRGRPPTALVVRFLLACRDGHLDEFPWVLYAHKGEPCANPLMSMQEFGVTGEAVDIYVKCLSCEADRPMVEAFGPQAEGTLPKCRGRHPHLGTWESCDRQVRTILLGASNMWFPETISVLSVPRFDEPLHQRVADLWDVLEDVTSAEILEFARKQQPRLRVLSAYSDDEILAAIEAQREPAEGKAEEQPDVLVPEWEVLSNPQDAPKSDDFRLRSETVPGSLQGELAEVVLAERLREVAAVIGFTRIDSPGDRTSDEGPGRAPLSRESPTWVPCAETRGEGIFLRFPEDAVRIWEERVFESEQTYKLFDGHQQWRTRRGLTPDEGFPGMRYFLLHTFSHILMRELALEAGYGAASIRERLYAQAGDEPMAGVLLYTAATDSEGTLGGLVSLGEPATLNRIVEQALEHTELCTSDPMCAEHDPTLDSSTHGAACHACLFASETPCERGNRYLDRTLLVNTLTTTGLGYFKR